METARESVRKFVWDEEDRLLGVDLRPESSRKQPHIAAYTYDAGGERGIRYVPRQQEGVSSGATAGYAQDMDIMLYPNALITVRPQELPEDFDPMRMHPEHVFTTYTKHYYIGSERINSKLGTVNNLGVLCEEMEPSTDLINEMNSRTQQANQQLNKLYQDLDKELEIATPYLYSTSHSLVCGFKSHNPKMYDAYWYHPDHLGSSSFITNTTGEISQHMEYLPFGETLVEEHLNSYNSPFKFNAKEFDAETGNYYYGARYYNPKWSTFLTPDPALESYPGISPYAYTLNNPVRYVDPTGMYVEERDDWIYDKNSDTYVWKEEIKSPSDIDNNKIFEYVGPKWKNIEEHYAKNLSFSDRFRKALGVSIYPNVDRDSYVSAKVTPKLQEAIEKQKHANQKFVNSDSDFATQFISPAIDLNIGIDRSSGVLSSNSYKFSSSLIINGKSIDFKGELIVRSKNANYINNVDASRKTFATPFGETYFNPVIFSGKGPSVIIQLNSKSNQNKINNYMWDF